MSTIRNRRHNQYRTNVMTENPGYSLSLATDVAARAASAHSKIDVEIAIGDHSAMSELYADIRDSPAIRDMLGAKVGELESALGWRS